MPWLGAQHICDQNGEIYQGATCKTLNWWEFWTSESDYQNEDGFPMIQANYIEGKRYCGKKIFDHVRNPKNSSEFLDEKTEITFLNSERPENGKCARN